MLSGSVTCVSLCSLFENRYPILFIYYPIFIYVTLLKLFSGSVACVAFIKNAILYSHAILYSYMSHF